MNKKLISFVTALTMVASMCVVPAVTASAEDHPLTTALMEVFDAYAPTGEFIGTDDIKLKKSQDGKYIELSSENSGDYANFTELLTVSNVSVNNSDNYSTSTKTTTNLNTKVELDMGRVGTVYADYIQLAKNLCSMDPYDGFELDMINNSKVNGTFTVSITIPEGLDFKDDTLATDSRSLAGFSFKNSSKPVSDIFTESRRRYDNNILTIEIAVDKSREELEEYFDGVHTPDLVFEGTLVAPAPTSSEETYLIKGTMTGKTDITSRSGVKLGEVTYRAIQDDREIDNDTEIITDTDVFITEEITIKRDSSSPGGGGSTYYTVKFESNGGSAVSPQTVARNGKATKPTDPTYEGHTFEGWYTDKELTTLYDFNTPVTKNITLYAKWTEVTEPTPTPTPVPTPTPIAPSHPVPDDLNGDDHFAYIVGYPEGDVRPVNNITRAEVATIFFRLLEDEVRDGNLTQENVFLDVNEGDWYNAAISTLANLGILTGRTDVEFAPNAFITRAEFATIAARFDDSEYGISDDFSDVAEHWAEEYIHEAADYGWITGYEDGTFRPDKLIIRAEAMTIINRVLQRVPENTDDLLQDMVKWSDNMDTSKWYYIAVQEATNSHDYNRKESNFEKWTKITAPRDWTTYEK